MLSAEKIMEKLEENKRTIKSFGVKRIGLFGSFVRNEQKDTSDIDIVVEFERGMATFKNVSKLVDFLESLFGRKVDLLTPDGIESIRIKHVKREIIKEVKYVHT